MRLFLAVLCCAALRVLGFSCEAHDLTGAR